MNDIPTFVIETGVDIYEKAPRNRSGKWKDLAMNMSPPAKDKHGKMIYSSVSHSEDGQALTNKEATALANALARAGFKSATRRNGNGGFRVWRIK